MDAEAVQKGPDQQVGRAKVGDLEGATPARKSDPYVGHGNGKPDSTGEVGRANGAGSVNGRAGIGTVGQVDKSALPISAPRRIRDKDHLRYVASLPCLVCGRSPGHAHHIRIAQPRAMGRKVSDEWTVPLCATHHRALHTVGNEETWWKMRGIDPVTHAEQMWCERRGRAVAQSVRARELISPTPS